MTAQRKCRYCLYWHSRLPGGVEPKDETIGECRFNPPVSLAAGDIRRASEKRGFWPETHGKDWCGQFSLHRWPQRGGGFMKPPPLN